MNRAQRRIFECDYPVGDPYRGAPYGERLDPATMGATMATSGGSGGMVSGVGALFSAMGAMKSGDAAARIGTAQQQELDAEAARLEQNAGQANAAAQRNAEIERRKTALVVSRGIAVAAAGGGSVTDPTVTKLISAIAGEGEYRSAAAIYQGEEIARDQMTTAAIRRSEGDAAFQAGQDKQSASQLTALGMGAAGAGTLYSKYGQGGPKAATLDNPWAEGGRG